MNCRLFALLLAAAPGAFPVVAWADPPALPHTAPGEAGVDAARLEKIDAAVEEALAAGRMPGCVVAVGRRGRIIHLKAYGHRRLLPEKEKMTTDTVFDLASLTKPLATATSVMILIERGKIELHDPVAKHLPGFGKNGKEAITIYQLLTHQGGLLPDNPLRDYENGREEAMRRIYALEPSYEPGKKFVYSDVGFIVLGELVRQVSGQDVNEFSRQNIFAPLGMNETGYLPASGLRARAAPTEQRGGKWIQGEVHDPRSYELGGVAGHAGLFSTAEDLCRYAQMMLGEGSYAGVRILSTESFATMTKAYAVPRGKRGLGWDIKTGYSSNRGATFSPRAFGHGGFTGTSIWMDPELELFVIFLSNRVHPDGRGSVNALAGRIGTIAADAISEKRLGTKGANSK